jgi:cell division protein FtsL
MSANITSYQEIYLDRLVAVRPWSCTVILSFVLFAVLVFKVWVHMQARDLGYELAEARAISRDLDMQRREFELQRSVLVRPDYLASAAQNQLGMAALTSDRVRRVR